MNESCNELSRFGRVNSNWFRLGLQQTLHPPPPRGELRSLACASTAVHQPLRAHRQLPRVRLPSRRQPAGKRSFFSIILILSRVCLGKLSSFCARMNCEERERWRFPTKDSRRSKLGRRLRKLQNALLRVSLSWCRACLGKRWCLIKKETSFIESTRKREAFSAHRSGPKRISSPICSRQPPAQNAPSFVSAFLSLSRACLSKMIIFI
eukprot:COSAG06_NODE_3067_length_5897_cov_5.614005_6_plen_208_part_00